MPSIAKTRFDETIQRAVFLRRIPSSDSSLSKEHVQHCYHAALASVVASWDSYIKSIVREFLDAVSNPLDYRFQTILKLLNEDAENALRKFNTPNWDNSRNVLLKFTSYDPISDWVWTRTGYQTSVAVRDYLNEVLRVRHAFAHGFPVPSLAWTTDRKGHQRLTAASIDQAIAFIRFLANMTDQGIYSKILQLGSRDPKWY